MKKLALVLLCLLFLCPTLSHGEGFVVYHGDRESNRVAVTMDDCYEKLHIRRTLALCKEYNVPVTFFVLGAVLHEKDAELWQEAIDLGCEIGNHTWGHLNLGNLKPQSITHQLNSTQQQLDKVLGYHYPMQVMRPPYGALSKTGSSYVVDTIAKAGYLKVALWDVSQTDFNLAKGQVQGGSILLYHANPKDVACLEKLIPYLLEKGYELVTVSELVGLAPVTPATQAQ